MQMEKAFRQDTGVKLKMPLLFAPNTCDPLFPGLVGTLANILEPAMSVVMTAGDVRKWRGTSDSERRLLLGRRLAQV